MSTLTVPQHMQALDRANAVRGARCALKRGVGVGAVTAASVLLDPPPCALTMPIAELLMAQRRWGDRRCSDFLAGTGIRESKTLGSLTERQRRMLVEMLEPTKAAA